MARKILIIFAIIIAIFPYLGFTDFADNIVTTILALLIALALLFSRKPKMIQPKEIFEPRVDMPSPFSVKMQDIHIAHKEEEAIHPTIINDIRREEKVFETRAEEIPQNEIISPIVKLPRKRIIAPRQVKAIAQEEITSTQDGINSSMHIQRRQRKNNERTILSQEESVQPADVPVRFD